MIEDAIQSEGVEEIIRIGNNKENLDVLSEEYMERLAKMQMPNTKVKLMERLLRMVITEFKKVNKMQGVDFSKRLNDLVDKYNDRRDSAVFADEVVTEVANQMAMLLKEINKEKSSYKGLGISYEEKAFYDILIAVAEKYGFKDQLAEDTYIFLAKEIQKLVGNKSKYTDWTNRQDVKDELYADVAKLLKKHGYPPRTIDDAYDEIMKQVDNYKQYADL